MSELNKLVAEIHETAKSKGWWSYKEEQANTARTVLKEFLSTELDEKIGPDIIHELMKKNIIQERSSLDIYALIVSEISEAVEEARKGNPPIYALDGQTVVTDLDKIKKLNLKPEGECIELIDAFIRIADFFGKQDWDFETALELKMNYNNSRSYRHGNKLY